MCEMDGIGSGPEVRKLGLGSGDGRNEIWCSGSSGDGGFGHGGGYGPGNGFGLDEGAGDSEGSGSGA